MTKPETFFLVWSPTGPTPPRHRHDLEAEATAEARRLAMEHPGSEFYVLAALSCVVKPRPDLVETRLTFVDDGLPF